MDLRYAGDDLPELPPSVSGPLKSVMARQMAGWGNLRQARMVRASSVLTDHRDSNPLGCRSKSGLSHTANWSNIASRLIETNKEMYPQSRSLSTSVAGRNADPWEEQEQRALKNWLLDRLETTKYRKGTKDNPELTTTAQMADVASADAEFLQVAAIYRGRPDFNVAALLAELVEGEAVPFLPILRYKPAGLRKRELWERTWDLQRQQDAGKDIGEIPVPPKYASTDFLKSDFWRLRGKLDVPKERWISYPHCSTDSDPRLVVGWAGWNHLASRRRGAGRLL